jgi:hypothetical protein
LGLIRRRLWRVNRMLNGRLWINRRLRLYWRLRINRRLRLLRRYIDRRLRVNRWLRRIVDDGWSRRCNTYRGSKHQSRSGTY